MDNNDKQVYRWVITALVITVITICVTIYMIDKEAYDHGYIPFENNMGGTSIVKPELNK